MATTVSMFIQAFKTKAQSRESIRDFRFSMGDIDNLNDRFLSLVKGKSAEIEADNFLMWTSDESIPVEVTTYDWVNDAWVANDPITVKWEGIVVWPGKISISINNPSNNTSDMPYAFTVVYG